jgi:nucleotide-binding universal stress UspA family protein
MKPITVGIDGSQAAIAAALWSVDEAVGRGRPLHLIAVISKTHSSADDYARDLGHAESSLKAAQSAIEASARPVEITTDIQRGPAATVLVEASRDAEMICVGSVGIGRYARALLGSTAADLAERAHCPVAVVRTDVERPPINWIIVRMTEDNDAVIEYAAWEAKLRDAPLLALGGRPEELTEDSDGEFERRVNAWQQVHPEVRIYPIITRSAIGKFLTANDERVQLAVIGSDEADQLAKLVGPSGHALFAHPHCSVLVVRG